MDKAVDELRRAGSEALRFNAPLGETRANSAFRFLCQSKATAVVDVGCGRGSFLRGLALTGPNIHGVGIDLDLDAIAFAQRAALQAGVADQVVFEVGDAAACRGPFDAAICIGSSHVFGDTSAMLAGIALLVPHGVAVIGDGVWAATPDEWCSLTFGNMPNGIEDLVVLARRLGWHVENAEVSTLEEWDHFEGEWCRGVRSVGTAQARRFADERADEYQRYRGVLGFGWLHLRR